MKNILFGIGFCFIALNIFAQNTEEQKYLLTNKAHSIGVSSFSLNDPYLSPLSYSGTGYVYSYDDLRFFSTNNNHLSRQNKLSLMGGTFLNPASTSSMTCFVMDFSWGMHYHFRPTKGLMLLVGGNSELDWSVKYIIRNVNNPSNVDLGVHLNLSGVAMYDFPFLKRIMQLQLAVQSPLVGCMFVPEAGASYYEMFELGNLNNVVHFSSLHNKRGVNARFMLQVPLAHTNWRLGCEYKGLKYSANEMVFKRNEISLLLGTTFDIAWFAGKKNRAPKNFMSPNE